jgi:hypothetical protein
LFLFPDALDLGGPCFEQATLLFDLILQPPPVFPALDFVFPGVDFRVGVPGFLSCSDLFVSSHSRFPVPRPHFCSDLVRCLHGLLVLLCRGSCCRSGLGALKISSVFVDGEKFCSWSQSDFPLVSSVARGFLQSLLPTHHDFPFLALSSPSLRQI